MSKSLVVDGKKKKSGVVKLKIVVERLQKTLHLGKKLSLSNVDEFGETEDASHVPDDVKKGHFAVIAVNDEELKRFIVPLSYLNQPPFLNLLEQAAEEYGFDHRGALMLPCRPSELERILAQQWGKDQGFAPNWGSCNKTTVKSC